MKILLDTHILLWHLDDDPRLSQSKSDLIDDPANQIFLSIASLWEIAIKNSIGKLPLKTPLSMLVPNEISILKIKISHLEEIANLGDQHRDPFDRLIISQATSEGFTILTDDSKFKFYPVDLI